jgi:hypothetical protein
MNVLTVTMIGTLGQTKIWRRTDSMGERMLCVQFLPLGAMEWSKAQEANCRELSGRIGEVMGKILTRLEGENVGRAVPIPTQQALLRFLATLVEGGL